MSREGSAKALHAKLRALAPAAFFLALVALFFLGSPAGVFLYDEGVILTGALRVMAGEQPAVDFYVNYGPAQFYMLATVFGLGGPSLDLARLYDSALLALVAISAWWVLRDLGRRSDAVAGLVMIVMMMLVSRSPLYPLTPSIALLLLGCGLTVRALSRATGWAGFLPLGVVVIAFTLFRVDFGLIAIAAYGCAILVVVLWRTWTGAEPFARAGLTLLGAASVAACAYAGTLAVLDFSGYLKPVLHDLSAYAGENYRETRNTPFPSLSASLHAPLLGVIIYFPIFAVILGIIACANLMRAGSQAEGRVIPIAVFCSATLFFYTPALIRTDTYHALISDIPAVILFLLAVRSFSAPGLHWRLVSFGLRAVEAVVILIVVAFGLANLAQRDLVLARLGERPANESGSTGLISVDPDVQAATRYVIETTAPDERILSATGRHDKVFIGNAAFYFLTDRLPGTRWHQYDPGVQTSEPVQRRMIEELQNFDVKVIVADTRWDDWTEPNQSAVSSGIRILDDYIDRNYSEVRRFGPIRILRRRG